MRTARTIPFMPSEFLATYLGVDGRVDAPTQPGYNLPTTLSHFSVKS